MLISAMMLQVSVSGGRLVSDAWHQISSAKTLTVTVTSTTEEFPNPRTKKCWFRKGGFLRIEEKGIVDVCSPKNGWTYSASRRVFQPREPLPSNFDFLSLVGLSFVNGDYPQVGSPVETTWHNAKVLRVELDGRKKMTRETKLYVFFELKSHMPVGISANLGSVTQVQIFKNLRLNPKLPPDTFTFTPPNGWKKVSAGHGGWN